MLEIKEIRFLQNYKNLNKLTIKLYEIFLEFTTLKFENKNINLKKEIIENDLIKIQDKIGNLIQVLNNRKETKQILNKKLNDLTIDDILIF